MKRRDAESLWFMIIDYADRLSELSNKEEDNSKNFEQSEKKLVEKFTEISGWQPLVNERDEWHLKKETHK